MLVFFFCFPITQCQYSSGTVTLCVKMQKGDLKNAALLFVLWFLSVINFTLNHFETKHNLCLLPCPKNKLPGVTTGPFVFFGTTAWATLVD